MLPFLSIYGRCDASTLNLAGESVGVDRSLRTLSLLFDGVVALFPKAGTHDIVCTTAGLTPAIFTITIAIGKFYSIAAARQEVQVEFLPFNITSRKLMIGNVF